MNNITLIRNCILAIGIAFYGAQPLFATAYIWQNGGDSSWQNGANWLGGSGSDFPDDNTDTASFTTSGSTTPTITGAGFSVQRLIFNGDTTYTITGAGKDTTTLRIDPNSGVSTATSITWTSGQAATQTFSNITINFDDSNDTGRNQLAFANSGRELVFSNTSRLTNNETLVYNITAATVAKTNTITINGDVVNNGIISQDDGQFILNLNATSWSGAGELGVGSTGSTLGVIANVQSGNLGTGTMRIGNDASEVRVTNSGITTSANTLTLNSTGVANSGTSGKLSATYASGSSTWSGNILVADPSSAKTNTFEVTNASASLVVSGLISGGDASLLTIQKTGAGTLNFSRAAGNTFTASAFNIEAGTLLASNTSGSATSTAAVAVKNGGRLGGTGIIAPGTGNGITVQSGGAIAPGASIGTLRLNGASTASDLLTMQTGSLFEFELGAPGSSDLIQFWSYAGASDFILDNNTINFTDAGGLDAGTYVLFQFYSDSGSTLTASGISSGLAIGTGLEAFNSSLQYNTDNISLVVTAVPEPSTMAAIVLGLCMLGGLRYRAYRNRKSLSVSNRNA